MTVDYWVGIANTVVIANSSVILRCFFHFARSLPAVAYFVMRGLKLVLYTLLIRSQST